MASLAVTICVSPKKDECSAQVSGSTQHLITDAEKKIFHATDLELKTQIETWLGAKCDGVWSTDPTNNTEYPDMHHHFNWDEVKVNLNALSATIVGFESKLEIIGDQDFTNNNLPTDLICNTELTQEVTSTVENTWSSKDCLGGDQTINYEIGFLGTGGGGETSINYNHEWGQEKKEIKSYTLGLTQGVGFKLPPSKSAKAQLTASRGTLKIEIKYRATLQGLIAAFFKKKRQDTHFLSFDINSIKQNSHLNTDFDYSEIIEITFFSNSKVDVKINENNPRSMLVPLGGNETSEQELNRIREEKLLRDADIEFLLDIMFEEADQDKNDLINKDELDTFIRRLRRPFDPFLLNLLFKVIGEKDGNLTRPECFRVFKKLFIDNHQQAQP